MGHYLFAGALFVLVTLAASKCMWDEWLCWENPDEQ